MLSNLRVCWFVEVVAPLFPRVGASGSVHAIVVLSVDPSPEETALQLSRGAGAAFGVQIVDSLKRNHVQKYWIAVKSVLFCK